MRLTRGATALLGLIAFVVLLATPSNAPIYLVMALLISLLLINIPGAAWSVRGLSIRREHATHVKEGSDMLVRLHVTNHKRTGRILLRFFDEGPQRGGDPVQLPLVSPHRTETVSYTCESGRRGVYRFETCRVESCSPFGLINVRRRLAADSELVVYPVYYELMGAMFPFLKTFSGVTAAPGARVGEGPSFFGLREYRRGDPIRKIHWPSTVRARTVMVKEFEEDMHSSINILLDSRASAMVATDRDTNLEVAIRVVASLANYTLTHGHPTTLMYVDEATGALRRDEARGDLTPVLDALARLQATTLGGMELLGLAEPIVARSPNCIAVLLAPDHDMLNELLRIRSRGTEILLVVVDRDGGRTAVNEQEGFSRMLSMMEAAGINVILMGLDDDVQATLSHHLRGPMMVRR
jgi:uncharacterized protein (DUF58 family)